MAQALLPLKDLVAAKTRLSGLLTPSERRALAQAMVEDVLACLQCHPRIEGITLVSDDPSAPHLAAGHGARFLDEKRLGCSGLNAVLAAALEELPPAGDGLVVVLHGDLPALAGVDLDRALDLAADADLVIGSDRAGTGTNLLVFRRDTPPSFRFGANSSTRHRQWAADAGALCKSLQTFGIGLDVDVPDDLADLLQAAVGGRVGVQTARLLDAGLGDRLAPVVASIEGDLADRPATGEPV